MDPFRSPRDAVPWTGLAGCWEYGGARGAGTQPVLEEGCKQHPGFFFPDSVVATLGRDPGFGISNPRCPGRCCVSRLDHRARVGPVIWAAMTADSISDIKDQRLWVLTSSAFKHHLDVSVIQLGLDTGRWATQVSSLFITFDLSFSLHST